MTDDNQGETLPELDPSQTGLSDMTPEGFRKAGKKVIDLIADYLTDLEDYPVLAQTKPGDVRRKIPDHPPQQPESIEAILADYKQTIEPNLTHWQHPAFMGYFGITGSGPGILADAIASAVNINGMLWRTSPSATELEERVVHWLRQLMDLPRNWFGIITDTASISSLLAVATARHQVPGLLVREKGLTGRTDVPRLTLYISSQTHSSLDKAAILLGLGLDSIRRIPEDDAFCMDVTELEKAIHTDRKAGHTPFCVVATAGTTSTTSIDPLAAIGAVCRREKLWFHVDAAYGGSAAIVPELRARLEGIELADSVVVNPHKWLFVPMHLSVLYCRNGALLEDAFSLIPEYLRTTDSSKVDASDNKEEVCDFMNYGVQLGRKFRALKLWMVLRYFGAEGLQRRIREHVRIAKEFANGVDQNPWMERLAPVPLSTVCFRMTPPDLPENGENKEDYLDQLNEKAMASVNSTGKVFLSHTRLKGRFAIRLVVSNARTTEKHVLLAKELLLETSKTIDESERPQHLRQRNS